MTRTGLLWSAARWSTGKAVAYTDDRLAAPDPLYGFAFTTDGDQA
ncbi:hypothetical protein LV564_11350 [Komagataeibacter nataicola]|nr:hypothetical protein [Komagataeibacter nataicola]WEQ54763.1 hypothetical protein LV564_11350 [Komagataeibacter nataicola]WNM09115.1 hypothetical protein RI056_03480 [Komagataeibacter nataicola]